MQQEEPNKYVKELTQEKYKYGFTTDVHTDIIERGLNEDVVRLISEKKNPKQTLSENRQKRVEYHNYKNHIASHALPPETRTK